jgi:multimeric flavodoxin WrbA
MKALCIIGSPKENGNTAFIVDKIIEGMNINEIQSKKYVLGEMNIGYCKGCECCSKTRECIQRDDMDLIFKDLFEADIILVASPSYWGDITGQLKVFIDRCLPLCNASTGETPVPTGKIGISVAIRAGQRKEENQHIIETIEHFFGHLEITPVKRFSIEGIDKAEDFESKLANVEEAFCLGKDILINNG